VLEWLVLEWLVLGWLVLEWLVHRKNHPRAVVIGEFGQYEVGILRGAGKRLRRVW